MPRLLAENQRIRDERHDQILQAAAHVFARKGLAATKITDIAAAAGVSHGLMYHYFASKEEIFRQLITRAMQGIERLLRDAGSRDGTVTERLRWLISELIEGSKDPVAADDALLIQQVMSSETVLPDVRKLVLEEPPKLLVVFSDLLREGQATGEIIAGDPDQLAYFFLSCIQGMVSTRDLYFDQSHVQPEMLLRLFLAR